MDARLPAPLIGVARMLLAGTGFFLSVISALLNAILGHVSPMQLPVPPPALPKTLRRRQRQSQTALTPRSPTSKSGSSGSSTVLVTPPDASDSDVQVASAGSSRLSAPPSSPSKIPLSSKILVRRRRKGPCSPKALEPSRSAPSTPLEELPSAFELTPPTPPSRATTLAPAHGASLSPFDSDECLVVEVQQTRSFTMNIRRALGGEKGAQKPAFARTISTPQVPRAATIVGPPAPIPRRKSCPDNKKEALSRSMTMSPESPSEQAALDSPTAERRNKSPFGGRKPQQRKRTLPYEAPYFAQTPVPPLPRSKPAASSDSDRRPLTADASATA